MNFYRRSQGNERANYQGFFLYLCDALGDDRPFSKGHMGTILVIRYHKAVSYANQRSQALKSINSLNEAIEFLIFCTILMLAVWT